jgi:hypothetical protein
MGSMFVSDDARLVGYLYFDNGVVFEDDTLAAQAGFEPGVDGAVDEIFFFFGNFLQEIFPFFNIDVAGAAGADASAVVVEVDVVVFGYFQDGIACFHIFYRFRGY